MSSSLPPPDWPSSAPSSGDATSGSWWTGGRIVAAIVIVLVLMALSAIGGFVAGTAFGAFDALGIEGVEGPFDGEMSGPAEDLLEDFGGFGDDVPGTMGLDAPAADGGPVEVGGQVDGELGERPVEHELEVPATRDVAVEVVEADFDTVLVLLDEDGEVVASDDDGGQGQWSRVEASLPAGTYVVRVQAWSGGTTGSYTLEVD